MMPRNSAIKTQNNDFVALLLSEIYRTVCLIHAVDNFFIMAVNILTLYLKWTCPSFSVNQTILHFLGKFQAHML
jgi:hypothetical protein